MGVGGLVVFTALVDLAIPEPSDLVAPAKATVYLGGLGMLIAGSDEVGKNI